PLSPPHWSGSNCVREAGGEGRRSKPLRSRTLVLCGCTPLLSLTRSLHCPITRKPNAVCHSLSLSLSVSPLKLTPTPVFQTNLDVASQSLWFPVLHRTSQSVCQSVTHSAF